jgi:hypothetical protein
METLLELFKDRPWVAAAALVVAFLVVYALLKKLFAFALILVLLLAGGLLWFRMVGHEVPDDLRDLGRSVGKAVKQAGEKGGGLLEEAGDAARKKKKDVEEDVESIVP